jgi:hypothetical protein
MGKRGVSFRVRRPRQRIYHSKVRLTLEIEADAEDGFSEADIGVFRDTRAN